MRSGNFSEIARKQVNMHFRILTVLIKTILNFL
jgi:hypothetical protein